MHIYYSSSIHNNIITSELSIQLYAYYYAYYDS